MTQSLFRDCQEYTVLAFSDKEAWAKARMVGIGGSDAAAFLGMGFKSLREVWLSKKEKPPQLNSPQVLYGISCEEPLRRLFMAKHPEMDVQYMADVTLASCANPWMRYSPDGLLLEGQKRGILEIKTYLFRSRDAYLRDWGNDFHADQMRIPAAYYCQVLHGLLVTGFDFVVVCAEIRYSSTGYSKIIERRFERDDVLEEMEYLQIQEKEKYEKYFLGDVEPPIEVNL